MAYRSAVKSSTGYTPYFLLYGKEMRMPLDIIYRPVSQDLSKTQYTQEIRRVLERVYDTAKRKLILSNERQNKYYDLGTQNDRFNPGDSVLHLRYAVNKGIAP